MDRCFEKCAAWDSNPVRVRVKVKVRVRVRVRVRIGSIAHAPGHAVHCHGAYNRILIF